ncbi:MAG: hypothetical protein JXQ83_04475 [Candidatus Glassbacteria bacterium]|nr:hypothetical protein [Candidatus Glassbacteria bacterium]
MDQEKNKDVPPGGLPGKPCGPAGSPDDQISIFSRNLELNKTPPRKPQTVFRPEKNEPPMKPADRNLYFRVEAGKVLEIIRRRISGVKREPVSDELVRDIHQSWRTLWQGDDKFPVGPFTEMFDIAFSILSSMGRLPRKLDESERSLLLSLVQAMSELAEGRAGVGYLESCRILLERARELGARLELEGGRNGKVAGTGPDGKAESRAAGTRGESWKEDISSAVDEWFDQVAGLIVKSGAKKTVPPAARPQREVSPAARVQPAAAGSRLEPAAGKEVAVDRAVSAVGESPGTEEAAGERPVEISPAPKSEPAGKAAGYAVAQAGPAESPPAATSPPAPVSAGDREPEALTDVVDNYFRECCARSVAVIDRCLERLGGSSPKRASRVLSGCLDELLQLSKSLEKETLAAELAAACESLGDLSGAPEAEVGREKARVREKLRRLVARLNEDVICSP